MITLLNIVTLIESRYNYQSSTQRCAVRENPPSTAPSTTFTCLIFALASPKSRSGYVGLRRELTNSTSPPPRRPSIAVTGHNFRHHLRHFQSCYNSAVELFQKALPESAPAHASLNKRKGQSEISETNCFYYNNYAVYFFSFFLFFLITQFKFLKIRAYLA